MSWLQRLFGSGDWSIHNPLKGWTLHGLTAREGGLLVCSMSDAEMQMSSAWKKGWTRWEKLVDPLCEDLKSVADGEGKSEERPDGCPQPPSSDDEEEVTQVMVASSRAKDVYKREYDRWEIRIPSDIILGNQTFSTHTDNISEGGMRFIDPLPDWVAGYFTVLLKTSERPFEITCMLVEDQKGKKLRVEAVQTADEESHLPDYRDWVRKHLK